MGKIYSGTRSVDECCTALTFDGHRNAASRTSVARRYGAMQVAFHEAVFRQRRQFDGASASARWSDSMRAD